MRRLLNTVYWIIQQSYFSLLNSVVSNAKDKLIPKKILFFGQLLKKQKQPHNTCMKMLESKC